MPMGHEEEALAQIRFQSKDHLVAFVTFFLAAQAQPKSVELRTLVRQGHNA